MYDPKTRESVLWKPKNQADFDQAMKGRYPEEQLQRAKYALCATADDVGEVAFAHGLLLHELSPRSASLEEAYMSLTNDAVEYRSEPTEDAR